MTAPTFLWCRSIWLHERWWRQRALENVTTRSHKAFETGSDCPCNILLLREVIFWDAPTENVSTVNNRTSLTKSHHYELSQLSWSTAGPVLTAMVSQQIKFFTVWTCHVMIIGHVCCHEKKSCNI